MSELEYEAVQYIKSVKTKYPKVSVVYSKKRLETDTVPFVGNSVKQ